MTGPRVLIPLLSFFVVFGVSAKLFLQSSSESEGNSNNVYQNFVKEKGLSSTSLRSSKSFQSSKIFNLFRSEENRRRLQSTNEIINEAFVEERTNLPIIYTFYERIDPEQHMRYTGMSDDADRQLLQDWKDYWHTAGWEPRILTLADAQRHPDFQRFDEALDLDSLAMGYKEKMCFLRWLAMAAVGGGFLADYDTFPIRRVNFDGIHLPNDGRMTIYDRTINGAIPSLISGSFNEYDRMSKLMIKNTMKNKHRLDWNELTALFHIYNEDREAFISLQGVLRADKALAYNVVFPKEQDCWNLASSYWAIHFSHDSIQQAKERGNLDANAAFNERPTIAEGFLNQWVRRCGFVFHDPVDLNQIVG